MSLVVDPYRFGAADTFIMPYQQTSMMWSSTDGSSGMTYTRTQSSARLSGGSGNQANAADADDGDYYEFFYNLAAGTYTLTVIFPKTTDLGIVRASLDGSSLGTQDFYAGYSENHVWEITGITVSADGNYTLRFAVDGKNASSTDYRMVIYCATMTRTGA